MLKPEQLFSGYLEELFRYRLALADQETRVREACDRAKKARGLVLKRADELLYSPDPHEEVMAEYRRLQAADRPDVWRMKNEVQFLLAAVRGIYLMTKALERVVEGEPQAGVRSAIAEFEREVPDRNLLRNIHEHMDEYLAGKGDVPLPRPEVSGIGLLDEGPVYVIGGKLFIVPELTAAAKGLGDAVAAAVRPLASD